MGFPEWVIGDFDTVPPKVSHLLNVEAAGTVDPQRTALNPTWPNGRAMCAGTAGSKSGMFVSLSAVIGIVIVLIVLGLWGASVIKNNVKQEKLASFGYPLGVIIECILIKDDLQRVSEVGEASWSSANSIRQNFRAPIPRWHMHLCREKRR